MKCFHQQGKTRESRTELMIEFCGGKERRIKKKVLRRRSEGVFQCFSRICAVKIDFASLVVQFSHSIQSIFHRNQSDITDLSNKFAL
jgi:hypothetical protein